MDVFEGVVADVEGFLGGDVAGGEGVAELLVEEGAGFAVAVFVGEEGQFGIEAELLEVGVEEGFEEEGGVELGVGDDAEGEGEVAEGGEDFGGAGHGPDGVGGEFVGDGEGFDLIGSGMGVGVELLEEIAPEIADFDFGVEDTFLFGLFVGGEDERSEVLGDGALGGEVGELEVGEDVAEGAFLLRGVGDTDVAGAGDDEGAVDVEGDAADAIEAGQNWFFLAREWGEGLGAFPEDGREGVHRSGAEEVEALGFEELLEDGPGWDPLWWFGSGLQQRGVDADEGLAVDGQAIGLEGFGGRSGGGFLKAGDEPVWRGWHSPATPTMTSSGRRRACSMTERWMDSGRFPKSA